MRTSICSAIVIASLSVIPAARRRLRAGALAGQGRGPFNATGSRQASTVSRSTAPRSMEPKG